MGSNVLLLSDEREYEDHHGKAEADCPAYATGF
jgi:hypothetical protein